MERSKGREERRLLRRQRDEIWVHLAVPDLGWGNPIEWRDIIGDCSEAGSFPLLGS